jgi:protoheme IX farnesyltransferase
MTRIPASVGLKIFTWELSRPRWLARAADYLQLTKPRIVLLELVTVLVTAQLAAPAAVPLSILFHTLFGAALVAASASAWNQWWERSSDGRMNRTADRPLPCGRLSSQQVVWFGSVTLLAGVSELSIFAGWIASAVALATWLVYVLAYTPLKSRSPLNTAVGAVSGALPILIGWTAAGAPVDVRAWALFSVVFLWQFPHFMAIAWLYRDDYARAGQKMLTVVDPTGYRAGAQALVAALALVPVSLVPALSPAAGSPMIFCGWAILLGLGQVAAAAAFLLQRNERNARRLLRATLFYLTCYMGILLVVSA